MLELENENLGHWLPQRRKIRCWDWYFKKLFYSFLRICFLVSNEKIPFRFFNLKWFHSDSVPSISKHSFNKVDYWRLSNKQGKHVPHPCTSYDLAEKIDIKHVLVSGMSVTKIDMKHVFASCMSVRKAKYKMKL